MTLKISYVVFNCKFFMNKVSNYPDKDKTWSHLRDKIKDLTIDKVTFQPIDKATFIGIKKYLSLYLH